MQRMENSSVSGLCGSGSLNTYGLGIPALERKIVTDP